MNGFLQEFIAIDLPALAAALLALIACGTLGNWLVLRKESMTGDAIAHAVLPGLVAGFLVTGSRSVTAMFAGASIAGVAAIMLAGWVRKRTRLEPGASLGVVFTAFFALGVALLESQGARQIDLDPDCVLFGSLETLFLVSVHGKPWYTTLPHELWTLFAAAVLAIGFSVLFMKELALLAFDRNHARQTGARASAAPPTCARACRRQTPRARAQTAAASASAVNGCGASATSTTRGRSAAAIARSISAT